jgi:ABC-type bacteriocin/lantibiotic exporter with double-glycine peptidase domain
MLDLDSRSMSAISQLLTLVCLPWLAAADSSSPFLGEALAIPEAEHVRRQERDAANCLTIVLQAAGFEPDAAARAQIDAVRSFRDMEQVSAKLGRPLKSVRMSFRDLVRVGRAICYVEESVTSGGQFVIAMSVDDGFVWVIHGGTATTTQMTEDKFRQIWQGLALVPALPPRQAALAFFEPMAALSVGWYLGRLMRRGVRPQGGDVL